VKSGFASGHRECKADHDEFFFAHGSGVPHPEFEKMLINSASARRRTRSRREQAMATSVDLGKVLDRAYEDKSLQEIPRRSAVGLAGLTERHNQVLSEIFGIQTVAELGSNKYFALAGALAALANKL
jgi:hypothetical protein